MNTFLNTQLSIGSIKEFITGESYEKYDVIDFQYYTGNTVYPSEISGLYGWFKSDSADDFNLNSLGTINQWLNQAEDFENQNLSCENNDNKPSYNFVNKSVDFQSEEFGDSPVFNFLERDNFEDLSTGDRCYFCVFEFKSLKDASNESSNLNVLFDADYPNTGFSSGYLAYNSSLTSGLSFFGEDPSDNEDLNGILPARDFERKTSILSILKNNTSNSLTIRNNGVVLTETESENLFNNSVSSFRIGSTPQGDAPFYDNSNISFKEIVLYENFPSEEQILGLEKYLFLKHFKNENNVYIASQNVVAQPQHSPITDNGSNFFTKNINNIFNKTYGCSAVFTSKLFKINYGDGYYVNTVPNINNITANFSFSYEGLTDKQTKAIVGFFESSFENKPENDFSSYKEVEMDCFFPYKTNSKIYFNDLTHNSVYKDINNVSINCKSLYDSNLNYKGMFVLDGLKTFEIGESYSKHDFVFYKGGDLFSQGYYWYTGTEELTQLKSTIISPISFGSNFTNKFYFSPDLDYEKVLSPRFIQTEFDTSSPSMESDGINKNILEFNYTFSNRSDKESLALLKFLDDKAGFKIFEIDLPQPYNRTVSVYCPEWKHEYVFKDNHSITIKLLEFKGFDSMVGAGSASDIYFKTIITL